MKVKVLKVKALVAQSCPTFCDPMDYSLLGSSVHGILQARIREWVAIPFSRWSSQPRDQTWVSCIADRFCTIWTTREAQQDRMKGTGLFGDIFKIFALGLWIISEQICWSFSGLPVATAQGSQLPASEHITLWVLYPRIWRERDLYGLGRLADLTLVRALQFVILRGSHVTLKIRKQFSLKITILALGPPISKPLKGPFVVCHSWGMWVAHNINPRHSLSKSFIDRTCDSSSVLYGRIFYANMIQWETLGLVCPFLY